MSYDIWECSQCSDPLVAGEIEVYNDLQYHPFCAAVARTEAARLVAERLRKEKLQDENPWLWEFKQRYDEWLEDTFNKPNTHEYKYY